MKKLLLQLAAENPVMPGRELLSSCLSQQAALELMMDIRLAHALGREAVVCGARMALRFSALKLRVPAGDLDRVLRVSDIGPHANIPSWHLITQTWHASRQNGWDVASSNICAG